MVGFNIFSVNDHVPVGLKVVCEDCFILRFGVRLLFCWFDVSICAIIYVMFFLYDGCAFCVVHFGLGGLDVSIVAPSVWQVWLWLLLYLVLVWWICITFEHRYVRNLASKGGHRTIMFMVFWDCFTLGFVQLFWVVTCFYFWCEGLCCCCECLLCVAN